MHGPLHGIASMKNDSERLAEIRATRARAKRRYETKLRDAGLFRAVFWVTDEERNVLRDTLKAMRQDDAA